MSECVPWPGRSDDDRANMVARNGVSKRAYVWAWIDANGPVPEGLQVNHICDWGGCVNVEHLYVGTQGDNIRDAVARKRHSEARKTTCPAGHPYSEHGAQYHRSNGKNNRICLTCRRENDPRKTKNKNKAAS